MGRLGLTTAQSQDIADFSAWQFGTPAQRDLSTWRANLDATLAAAEAAWSAPDATAPAGAGVEANHKPFLDQAKEWIDAHPMTVYAVAGVLLLLVLKRR